MELKISIANRLCGNVLDILYWSPTTRHSSETTKATPAVNSLQLEYSRKYTKTKMNYILIFKTNLTVHLTV